MKQILVTTIRLAVIVLGITYAHSVFGLTLSSPAFNSNSLIPTIYTCQGEDKPPPLAWSDIPKNSKSFALTIEDPDAANGNWTHWVVFNIPSTTTSLSSYPLNNIAIEGKNSWGSNNYRGPCPPHGSHHYIFTLYALDNLLSLPPGANASLLDEAIQQHVLAKASLVGIYSKQP